MAKNYDITELLRSKTFSELEPDEKAFVLNQLEGKEEYNALRMIVIESKDDFDLTSSSKKRVMDAFDEEFPNSFEPNKNKKAWNYWPYAAAAASIVLLLIIGGLYKNQHGEQLAENKAIEKKDSLPADTVINKALESVEESLIKEEHDKNTPRESEQIAELKKPEVEDEEPKASEFNLETNLEEVVLDQADEAFVDDAVQREVVEAEENVDAGVNAISGSEAQSPAADEAPAYLETFSQQKSSVEVKSLNNNAPSKRKGDIKGFKAFNLKRINKGHYTSY